MTEQEFNDKKYLDSIKDTIWIDVELKPDKKNSFDKKYLEYTGLEVPLNTRTKPYYLLSEDANKWGIELRLYFSKTNLITDNLLQLSVKNNMHGYEQYDRRINNNAFIWKLFDNGYNLGQN
jgi:hypothetical protein